MKPNIKIIDHGWERIQRELKILDKILVKCGLFGDGDNPELNLAYLGSILEYGTRDGHIPPRPFTRKAFDNNKSNLKKKAKELYIKVADGKITAKKAIQELGVYHETQIKKSIRNGNWTANAPITIKRKKSDRPLIDTGEMLNSVTSKTTTRR
jgi:hypothetical protein